MRRLVAALILLSLPLPGLAQVITSTPPSFTAIAGWQDLATLSPGTTIYVYQKNKRTIECELSNLTTDTLVCLNGMGTLTFQKSDVVKVKRSHRTRSAWIGFAIGYGVADILIVAGTHNNVSVNGGVAIAFFSITSLVMGPIIGHITDFARTTEYRAQP